MKFHSWGRRLSPVSCVWETVDDLQTIKRNHQQKEGRRSRSQQQRVTTVLLAARPVATATGAHCTVLGWVINYWCNWGYESTFRKPYGWIKLRQTLPASAAIHLDGKQKDSQFSWTKARGDESTVGTGFVCNVMSLKQTSKKNTKYLKNSRLSLLNTRITTFEAHCDLTWGLNFF